MCGIFAYIGKRKDASLLVIRGLKALEYRGYDSWGIAILKSKVIPIQPGQKSKNSKQRIIIIKQAGRISDVSESNFPDSNFALGHTRWATHGGVNDINAHPHFDCTHRIALIHNGIIENYDEIKKKLLDSHHRFISETDTEVAAHLIEENLKNIKNQEEKSRQDIFLEAVRLTFNRFIGLNAIIVMDAETESFIAAKNGSPLVIGKGQDENFLSSDAHALLPYTKHVYFMEDDELILVSKDKILAYEAKTKKQKNIAFTSLSWNLRSADKGKYPHFMLKEIFDQPKVIEDIISDNSKQIRDFSKLIKDSYGTYLVGCGTAAYACLSGTYLFSKIAGRHVNFAVGSEFGYLVDFLTPKSLVLALSQSGETIDVVEAIKRAKQKNAQIGALVNVLGSTLYRLSDYKVLLGAGVEKAVVSTKAFTAKLTYLVLLAYSLAGNIKRGKQELRSAIGAIDEILAKQYLDRIKKLSKALCRKDHIYVIGRGLSYPIALETALKIKEASYIHAEGFAAGELKHGVIALAEDGTPCIAFLPNDETYGASLAGAMEMKARGGYIIGISFKPHSVFDYYFPVRDCSVASIIPSVVIGQLLGYYLAVARNIDPDKPRNLAKSVTVK